MLIPKPKCGDVGGILLIMVNGGNGFGGVIIMIVSRCDVYRYDDDDNSWWL